MRIETWDLKDGDPITLYDKSNKCKVVGTIIGEVYEFKDTLYIRWEGEYIKSNRYMPHQYRGSAFYDEPNNIWILNTRMLMEE